MRTAVLNAVLDELHALRTDGELLERFLTRHDQDAFAALLHRHGPMVLAVGRRLLRQSQDAEDVLQATFLLLVRKAASIRRPEALGAWLHGVACRLAAEVRTRTLRREKRERAAMIPQPTPPLAELAWQELEEVVDRALLELPEHYRAPVVLCLLEGRTQEEAARFLGCPLGTLRSRLARGRAMLQENLRRQGLEPSTGTLAGTLLAGGVCELPGPLTGEMSRTALQLLQGVSLNRLVSASVAALVAQGLRSTVTLGLSLTLTLGLALGLAVAGLAVGRSQPAQPQAEQKPRERKPVADPSGLPLPAGALLRLGNLTFRHPDGINSSALSRDGKRLATVSKTSLVVWDVETGKALHYFRDCGALDGFNSQGLAFSPDGQRVACWTSSGGRVWDLTTGKLAYSLARGAVLTLSFSADGKYLILARGEGNAEGYVLFTDAKSGQLEKHIKVPAKVRWLSLDGSHFVAVAQDTGTQRQVLVGESASGKILSRLNVPALDGEPNLVLALSPDASRLLSTDGGAQGIVWNLAGGKRLAEFRCPDPEKPEPRDRNFTLAAFAPDGQSLVLGTRGGNLHRFDLTRNRFAAPLRRHFWWVTGVHFAAGGKRLISTGWDGVVRRWDLASGKEIPLPEGYVQHLEMARSPDGRRAALGDATGRLDLWDLPGRRRERTLRSSGGQITRLAFSLDSQRLAVAGTEGLITILEPGSGKELARLNVASADPRAYFLALAFSPDGKKLAVGNRQAGLRLWDLASRKEVWNVPAEEPRIAFSPDGRSLVLGDWQGTLRFLDVATGKERLRVSVEEDLKRKKKGKMVDGLAFSPDGATLASTHHDGSIRLWHVATGKELRRLSGHDECAWCVSFSPDGRWLLTASVDESVRLWELATGKEVWKRVGDDAWVWEACFNPDGRTILSATSSSALLWDLRPAKLPVIEGEEERAWQELGSADPARAYPYLWALAETPRTAVALFRKKLAKPGTDPATIRRWIAELDSDRFRAREKAEQALRDLGQAAVPLLRQALRQPRSPEQKQRIEKVLERLATMSLDDLRATRAVQVLERAGTVEARQLLEEWAKGENHLAQEAGSTLKRWPR